MTKWIHVSHETICNTHTDWFLNVWHKPYEVYETNPHTLEELWNIHCKISTISGELTATCSAGILRATLLAYAVALASLLLQFPKAIITALLFVAPFTYCYPSQDAANEAWAAAASWSRRKWPNLCVYTYSVFGGWPHF